MVEVNGPVRLVLTVELAVTAEPVEGLVRSAGRPDQSFSGWSELFAVLMALTSEAGGTTSHRTVSSGPSSRTPGHIQGAEKPPCESS